MAGNFKKGQHLFFLMRNGETSLDSQNKPRYYLSKDRAKQYNHGIAEIVEYAPITHGVWEKSNIEGYVWCSVCHGLYVKEDDWIGGKKWKCCPCCTAILDEDDKQKEV